MIPSSTIDDIRNKADILAVIGEYVPLKKRGKNYLGLCPFHSEKTPSFTVSTDKQIFHCFGCNEGGNIFAFIMKAENISFTEAVQMIGERVGIAVKQTGGSPVLSSEKDRYLDIMELAQKFYVESLNSPEGEPAQKYIEKRGLSSGTVKAFGLGYAPDNWDSLINHLFKKGVSKQDMEKLGLIIERGDKNGHYDRFRGRLMFPIFNLRARVIGFSGRILSGEEEAKYINSPDSPVYNKGYNLYGVSLTKDDIKKERTAILVEGNVDLVSCWQHGIKNVVAPLGTALTQNQAKIITRFADKVVIAFDQDSAGSMAAGRSVEILKGEGLNVYVAAFDGGKDPDESLRNKGADNFLKALKNASPWIEYKILSQMGRHNLKEIEGRAKAVKEAAATISQENDELIRNGYTKLVAEKLGFTAEEISAEVKRLGFYSGSSQSNSLKRSVEKPGSKMDKAEKWLIKLSVDNKDVLEMLKRDISPNEFLVDVNKTIVELLQSVDMEANENVAHFLLENLPDEASKNAFSSILVTEFPEADIKKAAQDCMNTIKAHHLKERMEALRGRIAAEEKEGRIENVSMLHKEFSDMSDSYRSLHN